MHKMFEASIFLKEMNVLIQQECVKLIKREGKLVTKDFYSSVLLDI